MQDVHGWTTATLVALVLDVIVNQERVVEKLERDR
jgi:hypothetical protein